jgi:HEAT repeat protein
MEALSNTDEEAKVLVDLTKALETIGPTTNGAAPVLLKLLSNPNQGVRMGATNALIRIDPAAAASAQVK